MRSKRNERVVLVVVLCLFAVALSISAPHHKLTADFSARVQAAENQLSPTNAEAIIPTLKIHPIIEMSEQCLIGGVENEKWVNADRFEKTLEKKQRFNRYTLAGPAGEVEIARGGRAGGSADDPCHDAWSAEASSPLREGIAIASPSWNVMPRLPRPIDPKDTTYVRIVSNLLKNAGIRKPEVKITQAYKVDLDGDGKEEVIIAANRYAHGLNELTGVASEPARGDYTFVLVRKIIGGKARNIFLVKTFYLKGDEGLQRGNHISAIADLNGDGIMEIVLYSAYHEGSASDVVQLKGSKATSVLGCACEI